MKRDEIERKVDTVIFIGPIEAKPDDYKALAVALVTQGYSVGKAIEIASEASMRTDAAIQMLARHRVAAEFDARRTSIDPDTLVYGWIANDGSVYTGEGYPVPWRKFNLDRSACVQLLFSPSGSK